MNEIPARRTMTAGMATDITTVRTAIWHSDAATRPGRWITATEASAALEPLAVDEGAIRQTAEFLDRTGSVLMQYGDYRWPRRLLDSDLAPSVLYAAGNPDVMKAGLGAAAIVGARDTPHPDALDEARSLGTALATLGVTVVSGLARGIDSAGHRGALDGGGATVGVLGEGLDRRISDSLASLIASKSTGCVVSQFPLSEPPRRDTYFARNRIIAGLSDVSIGVDLREASGTRNELRSALALGKPVVLWGPCMRETRWAREWEQSETGVHIIDDVDSILRLMRPRAD